MLLLRIWRLREAKWITLGHTAGEGVLGSPSLAFLAPGSMLSSWQTEEQGEEAKEGAGDEPWVGWLWALMGSAFSSPSSRTPAVPTKL